MAELIRASADIGGTFTDVVLAIGETLHSKKILTSYRAPESAIVEGLSALCEQTGVHASDISQVIHGTTLATNTLIERSGARTALVTTAGFRDVIETRTESRFDQYDLKIRLPEPLVHREHRFGVVERMSATGDVLINLAEDSLASVIASLVKGRFESIAVAFLHAYANPTHEQRVRDAIAKALPDAMVSISSEVSPQMREYERFNTTVANAYVQPLMKSYLQRLEASLGDIGVGCPVFLMHSGGGIISLSDAAAFPVRLVESGPAGGAVFAALLAEQNQWNRVLSFDMGGTTAKICLIRDGEPSTSNQFEVARSYRFKKGSGMPISIPVVDMVEIGAGGGSLASVDVMQQIRVGPESAASEPGPACYGQGGSRPAVTDADLVLGRLRSDNFANGAMVLREQPARQAIDAHVGHQLHLEPEAAAFGIAEMVDENMANAARVHAVENGEELADYTMIAFGGAAPLHAARLSRKLGIKKWLVPASAGVGSAVGFLRAPVSFEATRGYVAAVSSLDMDDVSSVFAALLDQATGFVGKCAPGEALQHTITAFMRYRGQGWEIPVRLDEGFADHPTRGRLVAAFESAYRRLYGRNIEGIAEEVTGWAVKVSTQQRMPDPLERPADNGSPTAYEQARVFSADSGAYVDASVYRLGELLPGQRIFGPAIVCAAETTVMIESGQMAIMQADTSLLVEELDNE
ncbi:MAG: hydantoinase/oxoprolinase family protein [Pseudomonadota bacterium]